MVEKLPGSKKILSKPSIKEGERFWNWVQQFQAQYKYRLKVPQHIYFKILKNLKGKDYLKEWGKNTITLQFKSESDRKEVEDLIRKKFNIPIKEVMKASDEAKEELLQLFDRVREKIKLATDQIAVFDALTYMDRELVELRKKYKNKLSSDEFWKLNEMVGKYIKELERYAKWKLSRTRGERILTW